jgi:hypothetical protein
MSTLVISTTGLDIILLWIFARESKGKFSCNSSGLDGTRQTSLEWDQNACLDGYAGFLSN